MVKVEIKVERRKEEKEKEREERRKKLRKKLLQLTMMILIFSAMTMMRKLLITLDKLPSMLRPRRAPRRPSLPCPLSYSM